MGHLFHRLRRKFPWYSLHASQALLPPPRPTLHKSVLFVCFSIQFNSIQSLSCVRLCATPWTAARQASLSITNFWSPRKPCPLSQWCHPTISSSVVPFSSCPQSFPASRSFSMNQLFASGGQSIGVSASASGLPMNTQDWSPLGWTGWISLQSLLADSQESSPTPQFSFLYSPTLIYIHDHWKNRSLD